MACLVLADVTVKPTINTLLILRIPDHMPQHASCMPIAKQITVLYIVVYFACNHTVTCRLVLL